MKEIKCPELSKNLNSFQLFLGGGITNCPNWQKDFVEMLANVDNLCLLNPRRDEFDITNLSLSSEHIEWEHEHLTLAEAIVFWFPAETLCPITLFELGFWAGTNKTIFVGCHPNYARKFDVEKQLSLISHRTKILVTSSLEELANQVRKFVISR
jgi:hypothetical protein